MGLFFIDTAGGAVATQGQLVAAGITRGADPPPRPWLRIQGTRDASTMWYAVMRKRERGVFIGTLVVRHSAHHALLVRSGWEEIPVAQIGVPGEAGSRSTEDRGWLVFVSRAGVDRPNLRRAIPRSEADPR